MKLGGLRIDEYCLKVIGRIFYYLRYLSNQVEKVRKVMPFQLKKKGIELPSKNSGITYEHIGKHLSNC